MLDPNLWREGTVALKRVWIHTALALALLLPMAAQAQEPPAEIMSKFKVGDVAPDFTLPDQAGKPVKLSDFRGKKNVVLAFYVLAFTGG
ncbi:MAG: redoxin domain-containing protein [Acidobacteria bacterium]|nr:redoxin domain-containing protein [Acidobacteriota bacterium]